MKETSDDLAKTKEGGRVSPLFVCICHVGKRARKGGKTARGLLREKKKTAMLIIASDQRKRKGKRDAANDATRKKGEMGPTS